MALRVTPGMMNLQMIRNINTNLVRMDGNMNVLSTGMKLNKPSDDPVGITYSLRYRSELSFNDQYQKNADTALSWLEYTDTVIGQVNEISQRANELIVNAVNGTNPQEGLDAINIELKQIYEQLISLGNSKFNDKYIFNGQLTDQAPYDKVLAPTQGTDLHGITYKFTEGATLNINVTGQDVFGEPSDPDNLFSILNRVQAALTIDDKAAARTELDNLSSRLSKINEARSEIGAKTNRVDLIFNRLGDLEINLTAMQAKVEDADYAETIMKLKQDESVYQASLATSAKIMQISLLDYLR
ncbi:flagellar hook-associated protein FlgL [Paenibacillus sp. FSL H8-0457]|uniref:flagellar hook-associated protein FlgL n=1 Tax=unclassified Paenibacillus TaxID=185978 RepID=UPI00017890D8|nr:MULTISPECIES: flagellar hook-associated protein FlgL [unclassified Paenibacillus]ACX68077.1 flagellar hook-associated protein 3 [Paenibacillus sp. Y412MC10]ETT67828.1 flagellar hook-associated protein 3 [Paenibacillus sp. FSL H8-457]